MAATDQDPNQWLLHVDMDQFIAAVEIRRRPELRGLPVVVGGDGDPGRPRQVVATATYEARAFGLRSGMPLKVAHRKCPDAVFLPSDNPAYDEASREVMAVLRGFGYPVEVWGWDEAVLGCLVEDPEALAAMIRSTVVRETSLSCAVGVGDTKERAKMATSFAKTAPDRVYRLSSANWMIVMGGRDVTELWGIGSRTAARLAERQFRTVAQLAAADRADLAAWFGPTIGPRLRVLARGGASRSVVVEERVARSRSKQVTYPTDLTDRVEIADQVAALTHDVCQEVFDEGRVATHVSVVVRTATFSTRIKTSKLSRPTTDPAVVQASARAVLERFDITRPVRLLGVRVILA